MSEIDSISIPDLTDVRVVGRGGFGVVYAARQAGLGRSVAIKILPPNLDETARLRYERECVAMGALGTHPNIVNIHSSGETEEGRPYIVMEFMPGGSLGDRIRESGAIAWQDALRYTVKLSGALETAHRAGILHRDIKPDNVLMSEYGEPELADFGIARVKDAGVTTGAQVTASLAHAPPEILEGAEPSPGTDVYSLASTAVTAIMGHEPFALGDVTSLAALVARIATAPVPDVRAAGVPDRFADIIDRAMAKDASQRFGSAADFGNEIRAVQRELGIPVTEMLIKGDAPADPNATVNVSGAASAAAAGVGVGAGVASTAPTAPSADVGEAAASPPPPPPPPAGDSKSRRAIIVATSVVGVLIVAGIVVAVVLLTGSGDAPPSPTAAPTDPTNSSPTSPPGGSTTYDLSSVLVSPGEVPAGWSQIDQPATFADTEYCGNAVDQSQIVDQVNVTYATNFPDSFYVELVGRFSSDAAAQEYMDTTIASAQSCVTYETVAFAEPATASVDFADSQGPDRLNIVTTFELASGIVAFSDAIYIRRGDVVLGISQFGLTGSPEEFAQLDLDAEARLDAACATDPNCTG